MTRELKTMTELAFPSPIAPEPRYNSRPLLDLFIMRDLKDCTKTNERISKSIGLLNGCWLSSVSYRL